MKIEQLLESKSAKNHFRQWDIKQPGVKCFKINDDVGIEVLLGSRLTSSRWIHHSDEHERYVLITKDGNFLFIPTLNIMVYINWTGHPEYVWAKLYIDSYPNIMKLVKHELDNVGELFYKGGKIKGLVFKQNGAPGIIYGVDDSVVINTISEIARVHSLEYFPVEKKDLSEMLMSHGWTKAEYEKNATIQKYFDWDNDYCLGFETTSDEQYVVLGR